MILVSGDYNVVFNEGTEREKSVILDYTFVGEMLFMCDCPASGAFYGGISPLLLFLFF